MMSHEPFRTREIQIGQLKLGGNNPIVVQSMTTTPTKDVDKTVEQIVALKEAGCDLVRVTVPTLQDVEALGFVKKKLQSLGLEIPLCADVHFVPAAALKVCEYVEKVRINPGNYADRKMFKVQEYTDDQYQKELDRIHEKFKPLVLKLKSLGRALRIGTNHGSLSDRILNRYGDSPAGMVESALEFARVCRTYEFHNFCFSMKASNVGVMVKAYRLLVERQKELGWNYPIHLGVTEAGDGEDGRLKSAIGIGTLLAEGIGDTVRVSLTESPLKEVPVATALASMFPRDRMVRKIGYSKAESTRPVTRPPQVWVEFSGSVESMVEELRAAKLKPDVIYFKDWKGSAKELEATQNALQDATDEELSFVVGAEDFRFIDSVDALKQLDGVDPMSCVMAWNATGKSGLPLLLQASVDAGAAFVDLPLRAIMISGLSVDDSTRLAFGILQSTRRRMSKTEYISCPSCGRTLFDLEETTASIKAKTDHLKGVKIGIMGCIVNGPGEMADADFGFVGGAPGRVNLYVGMECVKRNIPFAEATGELVQLIKDHGRWIDPPEAPLEARHA